MGWLCHAERFSVWIQLIQAVVKPQVAAVPEARVGIAEGLLARADASLDYFDHALAGMRALG